MDWGLDWDFVPISERFGDYWSLYFYLGLRKVTLRMDGEGDDDDDEDGW